MKAWILMAALMAASASAAEPPPNVVIIFTDDLGYADIGPFGGKHPTPHLDALAKTGRKFTSFYVAQPVCSASRAALLTGCYPNRVGIQGALGPGARIGISSNETTLAELGKQKGYATGIYGKWHLGHHPEFLPTRHGFDEYYGLPYSNDMWPFHPEAKAGTYPDLPLIEGEKTIATNPDQRHLTREYTDRATAFIRKNKSQPFLVYLAHSMPHVPLFVSERYAQDPSTLLREVIREIDWSVGEVMRALRESGVEKNTLVIFTSDNGPWLSYGNHAGSAEPLREGKGTVWEGGVRVPCVMNWPGKIPAGTVCEEPAMTIDLFPTVARLIGAEKPARKIDGRDISGLLFGTETASGPHPYYFYYHANELQAVRFGDWKLYVPHQYRTLAGRPGGTNGIPAKYEQRRTELELYHLRDDVSETKNVVAENPETVRKLTALLDSMREDLGDQLTGRQGSGRRPPGRLD